MATIKDVAKLAGVSVATVSRYINHAPTLTEESRARVEAAIEQLHYVPNTAAKTLKNRSSSTIALIVPEMSNPFYTDIYIAALRYALEAGYHTALFSVEEDERMFQDMEQQLLSGYYAGAIVVLLDNPVFLRYVECIATRLPVLLISTTNHAQFSCIVIDTYDAEYRATRYLLERGRKRVAFINGNMNRQTSRDKLSGYRKGIAEAGLPVEEALIYCGHYSSADGYYAARQFMMLESPPDAIVCANDIIAMGCIKYLVQAGHSIPDDVAVIGMDGTALAYAFTPSITTMEIPVDDICKEAVHMLLKKISHGRSANQIRVFQTVLVENRSTNKDAPLRFELG